MAFSTTAQWLAVSSDKGTVHVFSLKVNSSSPGNDNSNPPENNAAATSTGSSLSFIKGQLPFTLILMFYYLILFAKIYLFLGLFIV